jgi:hypothetical protein
MVVAFESRVTSLEQQLKTAKSKVESATNAVEQAQKKAEAAVTAAATDRASRDAALAEADAAREEAEQAVAERSQLLATVEREKVAEIARRAADVEKFREVQTTKDKRFEEALERKQLGFDHRVEQLITSHRQEIVTFETRVTEMRLTLEERNKTSRASQEELQKGELLIRQVQLAAVAREEELVEQLSTTNSAANAIREELQAALDRADQHTLQMMELNAAYVGPCISCRLYVLFVYETVMCFSHSNSPIYSPRCAYSPALYILLPHKRHFEQQVRSGSRRV